MEFWTKGRIVSAARQKRGEQANQRHKTTNEQSESDQIDLLGQQTKTTNDEATARLEVARVPTLLEASGLEAGATEPSTRSCVSQSSSPSFIILLRSFRIDKASGFDKDNVSSSREKLFSFFLKSNHGRCTRKSGDKRWRS